MHFFAQGSTAPGECALPRRASRSTGKLVRTPTAAKRVTRNSEGFDLQHTHQRKGNAYNLTSTKTGRNREREREREIILLWPANKSDHNDLTRPAKLDYSASIYCKCKPKKKRSMTRVKTCEARSVGSNAAAVAQNYTAKREPAGLSSWRLSVISSWK